MIVAVQVTVLLEGLLAPIELFVPDTLNVVETFEDEDVDINFTQKDVALELNVNEFE